MIDATLYSFADPVQTRPTDAELVDALADAALGRLDPERATALRKRLTGAMQARVVAGRAHGAKGGRPKGASAWYCVEDEERGTAWIRDLAPLADYLGLTKGSLSVYLNRGSGAHKTTVDRSGRTVLFTVRRATDAERAQLNATVARMTAEQVEAGYWTPPVAAKPSGKSLARKMQPSKSRASLPKT